jgi:hypothetical protein
MRGLARFGLRQAAASLGRGQVVICDGGRVGVVLVCQVCVDCVELAV